MSSDGFPYPLKRDGEFPPLHSADITAEQLLPFGYAPGNYMMKCRICGTETHNVDKRAIRCWQCAVNALRAQAATAAEDEAFLARTLAMTEDELRAEIIAEGRDPDQVVAKMRREVSAAIDLVRGRDRAQDDAREWQVLYKEARQEKNAASEEARSWRSVAERLEAEMQELLHACDCEILDQTNNRTASDKRSAAYAEGALRVAKGIAHRIREKSAAR